eukprot:COSAG05_NODE_1584_length_4486_cov_402.617506_9_plen_79_part_00
MRFACLCVRQVTFPVKESILCPICLSQVLEASVAEDGSSMVVAFQQPRTGQVASQLHYPYIYTARMMHGSQYKLFQYC